MLLPGRVGGRKRGVRSTAIHPSPPSGEGSAGSGRAPLAILRSVFVSLWGARLANTSTQRCWFLLLIATPAAASCYLPGNTFPGALT